MRRIRPLCHTTTLFRRTSFCQFTKNNFSASSVIFSDRYADKGRISKKEASKVTGSKVSSTKWLRRQLTDPYVRKAREEGMISRAAYKLTELDDRFQFLKRSPVVVDLGSAPGGWSKAAAQRTNEERLIISIDLNPLLIDLEHMNVFFIQADVTNPETILEIQKILADNQKEKVDCVLSDMAPTLSGDHQTDHLRFITLCESALEVAEAVLKKGGYFLTKLNFGGQEQQLKALLETKFQSVKLVKPKASRKDSSEMYFFCSGYQIPKAKKT